MITIPVTQIVSRNCGGCGAWLDNPLSSPSPGADIWPGFQIGGGKLHGRSRSRFNKVKVKTLRERRRVRRTRIKIKNTKIRRNTKNTKKYK